MTTSRSPAKASSRFCPRATAFSQPGLELPLRPRRHLRLAVADQALRARTGDTVSGQVRPPKEWERYLALLKVESVNGDEPEVAKSRIAFDNLRSAYPEGRLRLETKDGDVSMRDHGSHRADRQRPARADRVAAARGQDDSAAEDRQRDSGESSRGRRSSFC